MNSQDKCPICKSQSIQNFFQDIVIGNGHINLKDQPKYFYSSIIYNNPTVKKLVRRSYHLDIRKCIECNHLFQYFIFNPEDELKFHQSYFKTTGINSDFKTNRYNEDATNLSEIKFLSSTFNIKNILDIGACTGEFCDLAKQYNITPSTVDKCLITNKFLKEKNIETFNSISKINKTFNIIRVSHVLSHMHNDIEIFIDSLISKIDKNGIIYFIDHLNNNSENIDPILSPLMHVNLFSDKSFDTLINKFPELKLINHCYNVYNKYIFFKIYRRIR